MGRPGLDPGTLGVFRECPGVSLTIQIWWSNDIGRSPTCSEVVPSLISWLDDCLDKSSHTGLANVRFETSGGEVIEFRLGVG